MEMYSRFESREEMERMVNMGTVDGLQQAAGQIDGLLALAPRYSAPIPQGPSSWSRRLDGAWS
jgi:hypothetical protein